MEVTLALLLLLAVPIVAIAAKHGADAAQRDRERRWSDVPLAPPRPIEVGRPEAYGEWAAKAASTRNGRGSGAPGQTAQEVVRRALRETDGAARPASRVPSPAAVATGSARAGIAPGRDAPRTAPERRQASSGSTAVAQPRPARQRPPEPVIDINAAPVSELQRLPGIGVRAAQRIVDHREREGPFARVEDLTAVEGFDHHRVGRLAERATV